MHISQKHIKTIQRRIDFLTDRIEESPEQHSYDQAELAALRAALNYVTNEQANVYQDRAYRNGQKNLLKFYKKTLENAVRTDNVESLQFLLDRTNEWLEQADTTSQ